MHPYDAKSNFFSEMDVLRVRQSNSPRAAIRHVICVGVGVGADAGAAGLVFCVNRMLSFAFI